MAAPAPAPQTQSRAPLDYTPAPRHQSDAAGERAPGRQALRQQAGRAGSFEAGQALLGPNDAGPAQLEPAGPSPEELADWRRRAGATHERIDRATFSGIGLWSARQKAVLGLKDALGDAKIPSDLDLLADLVGGALDLASDKIGQAMGAAIRKLASHARTRQLGEALTKSASGKLGEQAKGLISGMGGGDHVTVEALIAAQQRGLETLAMGAGMNFPDRQSWTEAIVAGGEAAVLEAEDAQAKVAGVALEARDRQYAAALGAWSRIVQRKAGAVQKLIHGDKLGVLEVHVKSDERGELTAVSASLEGIPDRARRELAQSELTVGDFLGEERKVGVRYVIDTPMGEAVLSAPAGHYEGPPVVLRHVMAAHEWLYRIAEARFQDPHRDASAREGAALIVAADVAKMRLDSLPGLGD